jgi:hypothetical protein
LFWISPRTWTKVNLTMIPYLLDERRGMSSLT